MSFRSYAPYLLLASVLGGCAPPTVVKEDPRLYGELFSVPAWSGWIVERYMDGARVPKGYVLRLHTVGSHGTLFLDDLDLDFPAYHVADANGFLDYMRGNVRLDSSEPGSAFEKQIGRNRIKGFDFVDHTTGGKTRSIFVMTLPSGRQIYGDYTISSTDKNLKASFEEVIEQVRENPK